MIYLGAILYIVVFISKLWFFQYEQYFPSTVYIESVVNALFLAYIFFNILKSYVTKKSKPTKKKFSSDKILGKLLAYAKPIILISAVVFAVQIYVAYNRKTHDWDSVALYDARAQYMLQGYKFSQFTELAQYDIPGNIRYYFLYPPHTSILHYGVYSFGPGAIFPTGAIYPAHMLILLLAMYIFTKGIYSNKSIALVIASLVLLSPDYATLGMTDYTNMPYNTYIIVGSMLLIQYLISGRKVQAVTGVALVTFSQWIRAIEPVWVPLLIVFPLVFAILNRSKRITKRTIFIITLGLIFSLTNNASWSNFVSKAISGHEGIFTTSSPEAIGNMILGMISGAYIFVTTYFVTGLKYRLLWYVLLPILVLFRIRLEDKNTKENTTLRALIILILIIILYYYTGSYYTIASTTWWESVKDSLIRSSSYLYPLSLILLPKIFSKFKEPKRIAKQ